MQGGLTRNSSRLVGMEHGVRGLGEEHSSQHRFGQTGLWRTILMVYVLKKIKINKDEKAP